MNLDEPLLTRFFGAPPVEEDVEEREFFGSLAYRIRDGDLTLTVGFGSVHGDASLILEADHLTDPLVLATLTGIAAVAVVGDPPMLMLSGAVRGARGKDPDLAPRATITLDPIRVRLED